MNFQPEKITREHILRAFKEIDKDEIGIRSSTKYDILHNGKKYPPKDTLRLAHEYATGEYGWDRHGGEPTNKLIRELGFQVENKNFTRYDWVDTHKEICDYLSDKQNDQKGLIQLLIDVGINVQDDKSSPETSIPLEEIDPFTFFCHIYKHGVSKRLEMLQKVATALNIKKPTDESGIPSANAQKTWLFPYKYDRKNNEIETLWNLFYTARNGSLSETLFSNALAISGVGKTKLTESLFSIKPLSYFPINGPSKPYIKEVFGIDPEFNTLKGYQSILRQIKEKTDKSFPELSYEAWFYSENKKNSDSKHISVKKRFIKWLIKNPKISYFNDDQNEYNKRLDQYNTLFDIDIYKCSADSYKAIIDLITKEGYKNKSSAFYKFSEADSNHRPRAILGKSNYFEFLQETFSSETNYWLFQGNPKIYNITNALKAGHLKSWKVAAHKDKIKPGDKVIIWQTGEKSGCYALAEVTSEVEHLAEESNEAQHYYALQKDNSQEDRVKIEITHYNADTPLLWQYIKEDETLEHLNAGNQGTNFKATKEEYIYFENFIADQKKFVKLIKQFSDEEIREYFSLRDRITARYSLDYNDPRIVNAVNKDMLAFTVGQRYCWTLNTDSSKGTYGLVTTKPINNQTTDYSGGTPPAYFTRINDFQEVREHHDDCIKAVDFELDRTSKSGFDKHNNLSFEKSILDINYRKSLFPDIDFTNTTITKETTTMTAPLNQLFYGPPGTGKTYHTISEAAKIITGTDLNTYAKAKSIFQENLGERIEFITFHQNYSYEDFIQGLRPDVVQKELSFERTDGIFKKIATKALFEYYRVFKEKELKASITELETIAPSEVYKAFLKSIQVGSTFNTISGNSVILDSISNNNLRFKHFEGGQTYVVSQKRLLKLYEAFDEVYQISNINNDIRSAIGGSNATVYYVALREFIEFKKKLDENQDLPLTKEDKLAEFQFDEFDYDQKKEALEDFDLNLLKSISIHEVPTYVIIIDEINRANISRVFGELITLIEPDKRLHGDITLTCTLPSGERFIVPSNLHIIGTMNTADKSIALLDIALRRRFNFIPMYPDTSIDGVHEKELLNKINEQIAHLKTRDFTIGHAYFMGDDFIMDTAINNKVIPLLLEYFMNDEKEVIGILKQAGLEVGGWPLSIVKNA